MIRRPWWRDPLGWGLAATLVLGLLATLRLAGDVGRPFGGFLEEYLPSQSDRVQVDSNTPRSWKQAVDLDLIDSTLVEINGLPYWPNQAEVFAEAAGRGDSSVTLTVERGRGPEQVRVPIVIFTLTDYLDVKLPIIVVNLALWILAVVVYTGQPEDRLNRAASWLFCVLALALWTPFVSVFWDAEPAVWLLNATTNLAWPLVGAAVVAFGWQFPRPIRRAPGWVATAIQVIGLGLGLAWGGCRLWIYLMGWSPLVAALDGLAFTLSLSVLLSLSLVFFVGRLVWSWVTERDRAIRHGLFVVTVGLGLASFPIVLFILDMAGAQTAIILAGLDLRYLLLAIPASYAFVILRYRTFRTAHPLFLVVVILGLGALLSSLGSWLVRQALGLPDRSLSETFIPVYFVCLVASTFWATQATWQGLFSRLLQWERSSYASARSFGDRLMGRVDPASLPEVVCHALSVELKLDRVAVWRWHEARFALAGQAGDWSDLPAAFEPDRDFGAAPIGLQRPLRLRGDLARAPIWLEPLAEAGAEVAILLTGPQVVLGLLVLGKRWDEEVFDERDLEIVTLLAQQISLVWTSSLQMAELRHVPALLAETQTRERFRIAQDLHDTVQQRLGGIQLLLDSAEDAVRVDPERAVELLERCALETERTAQVVSRIRDNLAPPDEGQGLDSVLADIVTDFERRTGVTVALQLPHGLSGRLVPEAQNNVGLLVQQALDNIAEHAQATKVQVTFAADGDRLAVTIEDDGRGFTEARRSAARAAGSFGLQSMQARALSLGGELRIDSVPGSGTRVIGWVPLRPAA